MTTSPTNIRVLHPAYSSASTARELEDEYYEDTPPVPPNIDGRDR